jgi:hypothetical protein
LSKAIFTGDGDTAHEPAGPVSYWNRYVGVVQMHGHGTFFDERLIINGKPLNVDHRVGDDLITPILPQLEAYQWSIAAPALGTGRNENGALRLTSMPRQSLAARPCSKVKQNARAVTVGRRSPTWTLLACTPPAPSVALDKNYIKFSATKQWRVTPLKGIWQHPPYFHDGSGALNPHDRQVHGWIRHRQPWPAQQIG